MRKGVFLIYFVSVVSIIGYASPKETDLKPNDIDIFIKNFDSIFETLEKNWQNNKEWNEYYIKYSQLFRPILDVNNYFDEVTIFEKRNYYFTEIFNELINSTVPNELKNIFENIGWNENGNKIFWTIFLGYKLQKIVMEFDLFFNELEMYIEEEDKEEIIYTDFYKSLIIVRNNIDIVLNIINENDLKLIKRRISDIKEQTRS